MNAAIKTKTEAQGSSTGIIAACDQSLSSRCPSTYFPPLTHSQSRLIHRIDEKGYYLADGVMTDQGLLPAASDPALAEKLWKLSEGLVKQSF